MLISVKENIGKSPLNHFLSTIEGDLAKIFNLVECFMCPESAKNDIIGNKKALKTFKIGELQFWVFEETEQFSLFSEHSKPRESVNMLE